MIGALILNLMYKRTYHYKNQFVDTDKIKKSLTKKYDIVNLGSNHPKFAFEFPEEANGANWAIGPQTFEYDFKILNLLRPYLKEKSVIIIPICIKKFFLFRQVNREIHTKYYSILPLKQIVSGSKYEKLKRYTLPLLFHPLYARFIIRDVAEDTRMNLYSNPMNEKELLADADRWVKGWDRQFNTDTDNFKPSRKNLDDIEKNISILSDMIDYCIKEGLRPVITLLPLTPYLSSKFSRDYKQEYLYNLIKRSNRYDIPVMDYMDDEELSDPRLFINSFFYNSKGRKKFSERFVSDLESIFCS